MSKDLEMSYLLDFYGEVLTEKQRDVMEQYYNDDLSLSEIAEQLSITRQGVWDNIRRAEAALNEYEEKTGLLRRFNAVRAKLGEIREECEKIGPEADRVAAMLADLETEL